MLARFGFYGQWWFIALKARTAISLARFGLYGQWWSNPIQIRILFG